MKHLKTIYCLIIVSLFSSSVFAGDAVELQYGKWLLKYEKSSGDADYIYQGKTILEHVNSAAYLDRRISGRDYSECSIEETPVQDVYGVGICYTITRTKPGAPSFIQHFYLYEDKDFFLTDIELAGQNELTSNYLCPVSTISGYKSPVLESGDNRVLIIPFDNDKWVRYRSASLRGGVNSNEVTAVYNAGTRNGIVIGSVEHDVWKSGIRVESDTPDYISRIEFYTGAAGEATRDVLPHGKIKGLRIRSPKVLFGYFRDWRDGMETFGRACAAAAPPLAWNSGKPFGWNSWGKMEFKMTYQKVLEVSDFFKNDLQDNNFENDSVVYIGMDSGWNRLTDEQLSDIVQHCKANHQKAGIYFTPFSDWGKNPEREIEGAPGYKCKDAYLYANGRIQNSIAGGWAMDPTHPAIQQRIKYFVDKFKKAGFEYIKLDFLTHGALEADSYYDKNVTTGMQAYNAGMKYVSEQLKGMYITEAISPLFPAQYAHSRRIACDAWASMEDTEYTLNSLTYGWWLNQIYTYNDPDYFLLESATDGENRARITSTAITGIVMCGDDFSQISGLKETTDKAKKWMTNPEIMQMAKECKSFRPVNGNTDVADFIFTYDTGKELYIAVFNYFGYNLLYDLPLSRLGLDTNTIYDCKELWFGQQSQVKDTLHLDIPPKDVQVYRISNAANTQNNSLWYQQPAKEWMEASPLGNGRLGIMVYGGVDRETVALNESTMWSGQPDEDQEQSFGKEKLAQLRTLFFDGKPDEGNDIASKYLKGNYHSFGTHLPVGDLLMHFDYPDGKLFNYKRNLNLENAIDEVTFRIGDIQYKREYFCSNPDDAIIIRLTASQPKSITMNLEMNLLREADVAISNEELNFSGKVSFPMHGPGGVNFMGKMKILSDDGVMSTGNNQLFIKDASSVTMVIDIRTDYKNNNYKELCNTTVEKASSKSYEQLKINHVKDYSSLFNRVELSLGNSSMEYLPTDIRWKRVKEGQDDTGLDALFFQYARYLLIASSRENSPLPANLQGVWNDNLACNMGWTCDYHLDINTEQNYWIANVGNLPECNRPLFNYVKDLSSYGATTAQTVYGCRGWTAHTVANAWGYTAPSQSITWGLFPTAASWIVSHFWKQYQFTQNKDFLRKEAYPLLKGNALFLLDYMVENQDNGYLMTGPSISPENGFKWKDKVLVASMMPACDRALTYETFTSCREAAEILKTDRAFSDSLAIAIAKLPPVKTGKSGAIQEWFEDYEEAYPNHRHTSHLLGLYPFSQITKEKTPSLALAAQATIERRIHAQGWEDTEWSRANMICFYARLKKVEEAYESVQLLEKNFTRENLLTISPKGIAGAPCDIFIFDGNSAGAAGIAEMLIQTQEGYIEFLPALPEKWKNGYFKGLCVVGGGQADLKWENGNIQYAKLISSCDYTYRIKVPEIFQNVVILKNGKKMNYSGAMKNILQLALKKGDVLEMNFAFVANKVCND